MRLKLLALYYFRRHGMTINFTADQPAFMRKERKMNPTLLHKIRWYFGTGREPEDLKEADSSLCLHCCVSVKNQSGHLILFSYYYYAFLSGTSSVKDVFKI